MTTNRAGIGLLPKAVGGLLAASALGLGGFYLGAKITPHVDVPAAPTEKFPRPVKAIKPVECRDTPSMSGKVEQTIYDNFPFRVAEGRGNWLRPEANNCWVPRAEVKDVPDTGTGIDTPTDAPADVSTPTAQPADASQPNKPGRYEAYGDTQYTPAQTASFNKACEGMTLENNSVTGTPSYKAGFFSPNVPDDFLINNRTVWSTPTASGNECRVRIQAYGTVNGTSKVFDKQCRVTGLTVQDDGKIALDNVDWKDCQ